MRITNPTDLSVAVREARKTHGLSQGQLAEVAGVSREWVSRLENGSPRLEMDKVLRTVARLGITMQTPEAQPTAEDIEKADSIAWTMRLESQDLTDDAYDRLLKRIVARRTASTS